MKIYISTTFREFDGSSNDQIQRLFLERLSKEKNSEIKLIATTFGEKNTLKVLSEYDIDFELFEEERHEYRFSLTKVFLNAINNPNIVSSDFIIWTTCDVIFDDNFFSMVRKHCGNNTRPVSLISHPHLIFSDIEALENNIYQINGPADGIDFLGFSGSVLTKDFKQDIKNNFFSDWGVFEHFLVAVAVRNKLKRINIYEETKVKKICNDRQVNNETDSYFKMCLNKNWPVLNKYLKENKMSKQFFSLAYCNLTYNIPNFFNAFKYRKRFFYDYLNYSKNTTFDFFALILPRPLKSSIKRIIRK